MSLAEIERARRESVRARGRFERTLAAVQERLRPTNLAEEAWDGVKGKSADLADGALQAVKKRPGAVSMALGAFALFLARAPLKRAVTRFISSDDGDEGNEADQTELDAEAHVEKEGVS